MGENVVSPTMFRFERGRKLFRDGAPMPPRPNDDEAYTPKGDLWLGWMFERGCKMQESRP